MAKTVGRDITISVGGSTIAVGRTKSLTINNEPINVTADGDSGVQQILDEPGEKAIEVSIEGIYDPTEVETALVDLAMSTTDCVAELILTYDGYTMTGDFFISSYSEGQPYNDATTFSATFVSAAAITKAAVT